jgi:hypothetical protein
LEKKPIVLKPKIIESPQVQAVSE